MSKDKYLSTFSPLMDAIVIIILQASVVQRLDNPIHRINHYPVDSVVCFVTTYPLDSDLSGGQRYPAFEQLGPDLFPKVRSLENWDYSQIFPVLAGEYCHVTC